MSITYARVSGGNITPIRYSHDQLKFNDTIEAVNSVGDVIIPLLTPAPNISSGGIPAYRPPTAFELESAILNHDMVDSELHRYDLDVTVPMLNEKGVVSEGTVPDEIRSYRGEWDPVNNIPHLEDGVGNIGDTYNVAKGHPNDIEVSIGDTPMIVRTDIRIEYREDNKWYSAGFHRLSQAERKLLDGAMVNHVFDREDGSAGNHTGAYGIESYPQVLTTLKGGIIIGQLVPTITDRHEIHLVDSVGLTGLQFDTITGTIVLDAIGVPIGIYKPKFIVGGAGGQSAPIEITLEISDYTLESTGSPIDLPYGDTHSEPITSPQDSTPTLKVVDDGGLWKAAVSDAGDGIEVDTFCVDEGDYVVKVQASDERGESDVLDVPVSVTKIDDRPNPTWIKGGVASAPAPIPEEERAPLRSDFIGLGGLPLG